MSDVRHGTLENNAWIKQVPGPYDAQQVRLWLECMGIAIEKDVPPSPSLQNLMIIVKHFLLTFPFDNTGMHYTLHHSMDISPEGVFNRLVKERRGGSYCFGLSGLMLGMLRGLGFRAFSVLARVNERPNGGPVTDYMSLNHQVIFVQPDNDSNQTYIVDVGFGAGLVQPIWLSNAEDNVVAGIDATEAHRLTRTAPHMTSLETSKGSNIPTQFKWNLEAGHKKSVSDSSSFQWQILYSFSEEEFHDRDFRDASFIMDSMPAPLGLLWHNVVCVKYSVKDSTENTAKKDIGYRITMLGSQVKKHGEGSSEVIRTIHTDLERIQALRDIFGIHIDDEDARHIIGRNSALS